MRRTIATAVVTLGLVGSAAAADMAFKAPVPTVYYWAGFHIGLQAGYGWSQDNAVTLSSVTPPYAAAIGVTIPATISNNTSGFVGGVEWGTDWQSGRWVFGTESDLSYSNFNSTNLVVTPGAAGRSNSVSSSLEWFSTTRLRLGYTVQDNLLVYATGGLADARAKLSVSNIAVTGACAVAANCPLGGKRDTLWGWALGGGAEWGSGPWSAKIEYVHYDLGEMGFTYNDGISPAVLNANKNYSGDIVRGGVNYHFSWTPWQLIFGR
jgi:outer membrane immunogenic protein